MAGSDMCPRQHCFCHGKGTSESLSHFGRMKTLPGKVQRAGVKFVLISRKLKHLRLRAIAYFMSSNLLVCYDGHIPLG